MLEVRPYTMICDECGGMCHTVDISREHDDYPCVVLSVCHRCDTLSAWACQDPDPDLNIDPAVDPETGERDEELAKWSEVLRALAEKKSPVTP